MKIKKIRRRYLGAMRSNKMLIAKRTRMRNSMELFEFFYCKTV